MVSGAFMALAAIGVLGVLGYALHPLWGARRGPGITLVATLALTTAALYMLIGTPAALDPLRRTPDDPVAVAQAGLEATMRAKPEAEGLRLLARSYAGQGRAVEARDTYTRAVGLAPNDADLLAEAAEARAKVSSTRGFDTQAVAWLEQAIRTRPDHQRARWFLGIARRQQQRPGDAAAMWLPLLAQVDAGTAASLRPQIDAARKDAGLAPLSDADLPAPRAGLAVSVRLDPSLGASLPSGARVFVLARVPGTAMPVAVETIAVDALPTTVTLDDGDSPMPTRPLSQAGQVEVLARISLSGVANAAPGDLASTAVPATASQTGTVELVIDQVIE